MRTLQQLVNLRPNVAADLAVDCLWLLAVVPKPCASFRRAITNPVIGPGRSSWACEKGPETIARSPGDLRALKTKRSWVVISDPSIEDPAGSSNHRGPRRSVYPLHTLASRQARGGLPT